ncbi:hypothetical protein ACFU5Y_39810 [Streptomyces gardneri]|uniref:hypothetical protein n=1 Tax=Streptomyces gardneri TaxID=66892 RepID=UPI00367494F2
MPLNEGSQHDDAPHEGFEEELGAVLRSTGEGFSTDGRRELVAGGLTRGRRRLVRRRLAVTGGALALAAVGIGGVYGGSVLGTGGPAKAAGVAAAPKPTSGTARPTEPSLEEKRRLAMQQAEIPVKDIAAVVQANTPAGQWQFDGLDGKGQSAQGVYDDGGGKAAVSVGLYRAAGGAGEAGAGQVECPSKVHVDFDKCTTGLLPGGDRLMVIQGYEYPDRREDTKSWRAVLLTKDGFLVDASEWNAPAQKGAAVSRENPPFTATQLKALVTSDDWRPLLKQLPEVPKPDVDPGAAPGEASGPEIQATLRSLLPKGLRVTDKGGDYGYGFQVLDDGKGKSLVEINVQPNMGGALGDLFGSGDVTTLPDGRKVKVTQGSGEKGGAGVVSWGVDTMTPEGFRVVVSSMNAGGYRQDATRAEPALTVEQLKAIALSPKWQKATAK